MRQAIRRFDMTKYKYGLPLVIALVVLAALILLLFLMPSGETRKGNESDIEESGEETMKDDLLEQPPKVVFKAELSAFEPYMDISADQAREKGYLVLINKQNGVTADAAPQDLVAVKHARKEIELRKSAEMALEAMFLELQAEGISGVFVTSAYRSYAYQEWLFNRYIEREMAEDPALSREDAREKVLRYSAAPGTSEHQSGLSVDLMCDGMTELDETFASYAVFDWLSENAWKFGFVLRFPEDKTELTGYDYEPWHYRFVGREAAYEMMSLGICLEEYLG